MTVFRDMVEQILYGSISRYVRANSLWQYFEIC